MKSSVLTFRTGIMIFSWGMGEGGEGREGSLEETVHCIRERANELKGHITFANCVR